MRYAARGHISKLHIGYIYTMRERDHLKIPGVDGRIILKRIFRKWDGVHGLD